MEHEGGENHFFALYTITYGVTLGISTAANILTLYFFYEFLTLSTLPLVMHGTEKPSEHAGYTYMLYSFFGAALAFIGVMLVLTYGDGGAFTMGGVMTQAAAEHPTDGAAGLPVRVPRLRREGGGFPIPRMAAGSFRRADPGDGAAACGRGRQERRVCHHPRDVFQLRRAGACAARWRRTIALLLASVTIVYGSTMAVKEHHFKRRLAYSTVSNLSYIVLAASLMTQSGLTASLAHMLFHALIKITLFFCAGAVMVKTGRTQIEDLRGLSKVMPFTCATYTIGAISLMGTPLLPGFVSKWLIGSAAIETGTAMGMVGVAATPDFRRADGHLSDGSGAVDVFPPAGGHGEGCQAAIPACG